MSVYVSRDGHRTLIGTRDDDTGEYRCLFLTDEQRAKLAEELAKQVDKPQRKKYRMV